MMLLLLGLVLRFTTPFDSHDAMKTRTQLEWGATSEGFRLSLRASKDKPKPEKVELFLVFQNLDVRQRRVVASRDHWSTYKVSVIDAQGNNAKERADPENGGMTFPRPNSCSIITLAPGESLTSTLDLTTIFDLSAPGKYRVIAERDFWNSDEVTFSTAVSNQLEIVIE